MRLARSRLRSPTQGRLIIGFSVLATIGNNGERRKVMHALVESHLFLHRLEVKDLIRTAYMRKFGKDIPPQSLEDDANTFQKTGKVPAYLVDFMLAVYGVH